jgi:hypothetical protein
MALQNVTAAPATMPNIGYLLAGYDIMYGNPMPTDGQALVDPGFRQPVFAADYTDSPLTPDQRYLIPKGTTATDCSGSCSLHFQSTEIMGTHSYQSSLEVKAEVSAGGWDAKFSASTDYKHVEQSSSTEKSVFTESEATCCAYSTEILTYTPPKFHANFLAAVATLGDEYDEATYAKFINTFGTHFVSRVTMGGLWGQRSEISEESWSKMVQDGLDVKEAASASGFGVAVSESFETDSQKQMAAEFSKKCSDQKVYSIGAKPPSDDKAETWAQSTITSPAPISMKLEQLDGLFEQSYGLQVSDQVRANMQTALEGYCEKLKSEGKVESCDAPDPDPPAPSPPSSSCRFCAQSCGGKYQQEGGAIIMDQGGWGDWAQVFPAQCTGSEGHQDTSGGAHLCCEGEEQTTKPSCRLCKSCGGDFSSDGGRLMKDQNWPDWILAYDDSCNGQPVHHDNPGSGFSLCCSEPSCSLCASCGGDFPEETSTLSNDQYWPDFFDIRGSGCAGEPSSQGYSDGVSFCCKSLGPDFSLPSNALIV